MDYQAQLHARARSTGVNRFVYWLVRLMFQPFFRTYLRMSRIGREHIPAEGPVIVAANHRSFLDPFVIATMARWNRPMSYVTKREAFENRGLAWILNALGAFPVDRGAADAETIETAKAILARGDIVLIFPEGTRTRPGTLGKPKRGVGRLALETGAPVVPVAVIGTEAVRRGWRITPHKVRIRAGGALRFPNVQTASPALAGAVTERIWACVMLQWEWLGGLPPIRRAAIIGAGKWGTSLAVTLARAGVEVELGCRTHEQARALCDERENRRYLPGVKLPDTVRAVSVAELELGGHDLVCLTVPARALPDVLEAHGERIPRDAGLLVVSDGLVPPLGSLPTAFVFERCHARAVATIGGPADAAQPLEPGASIVLASLDRGFARQLSDALRTAALEVSISSDVTGVELAQCAKNAAALAALAASAAGPTVAGAVAGKVVAEVDELSRRQGGRAETFAGLAGAGDVVATAIATGPQNQRAGELLAQGMPLKEVGAALGQATGTVDSVLLLASAARDARLQAPALDGLAALIEGRIDAHQWTERVADRPRAEESPSPTVA